MLYATQTEFWIFLMIFLSSFVEFFLHVSLKLMKLFFFFFFILRNYQNFYDFFRQPRLIEAAPLYVKACDLDFLPLFII